MASRLRNGIGTDGLLVGAFVLVGLALRLVLVGQSMYGDELFFYEKVHDRGLFDMLALVRRDENTPPLGFVLAWPFGQLGGADRLVRIPSLIAGLTLIPLTYLLGRAVAGRGAGLFAAAFVTVSSLQIFYASESRGYALVTCLVLASTVALVRALQTSERRWWAVLVVANVAAAYTHYTAALILVPQAVWALALHRDRLCELSIAYGATLLAGLPWVPFFLHQFRRSSAEAAFHDSGLPTDLHTVGTLLAQLLGGHPFFPLETFPGRFSLVLIVAGVVVALGLALVRRRTARTPLDPRSPPALVVALAVAPLLGQVLYSLRPHTSFLLPRNVMTSVPYLMVTIGAALAAIRPRVLAGALAGTVLVGASVGAAHAVRRDYQRPDMRAAAAAVERAGGPRVRTINAQLDYTTIPPGRALLYYMPGRTVAPVQDVRRVWREGARAGAPVAIVGPPAVVAYLGRPPGGLARAYRPVYRHATPGISGGLVVRVWWPAGSP